MQIMVFDVPAATHGALTILREYYERARADTSHTWVFVIGSPVLEEAPNIRVLRYPWIKKSWLHRLWFDHMVAPSLVRRWKPDRILSLQNILVPHVSVPQTLYLQQPLPFVKKRYGFRENPRLWLYQHPIARSVYRSVKNCDRLIVQTRWMRDACIQQVGISPDKIDVETPDVPMSEERQFTASPEALRTFFYPASALSYKNHTVIVEAAARLQSEQVGPFHIAFTLRGDESKAIAALCKRVAEEHLPVEFLGTISHDEVMNRFTRSVLLFPSQIETFGLPMLEARLVGAPVLASDCAFSHEVLEGYGAARFFDPEKPDELAGLMRKTLQGAEPES